MITITSKDLRVQFNEDTHQFSFMVGEIAWHFREDISPYMVCSQGHISFADARHIRHEVRVHGVGKGILSCYEGFEVNGEYVPYTFETYVWIEDATGHVFFEWIPICEEGLDIQRIYWPSEMEFCATRDDWYTLINHQQGILIPNTWEEELEKISFDGYFGTAGGYMPFIAQVKEGYAYMAIACTFWNMGYHATHPVGGGYTHVGMYMDPSLGKMAYRRVIRYTFLDNADHNTVCKTYRAYVKEQGNLVTLKEKIERTPEIEKLIGAAFVHQGIKTAVQKDSEFFDPQDPEKNNHLTTFKTRAKGMRALKAQGVEKVYLHLDGWAEPGYDNKHPDYMPACIEAGGWAGMKELSDTMQELGYLFGIHDQYRDYYRTAPSFDEEYACRKVDGSIPEHRRWAGGAQSYLCATQAPFYVRRNFEKIEKEGIHLDCAYLDVFTCNEGDECSNPHHLMTRRDCYDYRNQCFSILHAKHILPSSEEVSDWAARHLVFCHYAPYDFMMREPGKPKMGIPVPLFNLVYHDCLMIPWMMDRVSETEDYMLYALLAGGMPYLIRDPAYPNIDGAFEAGESSSVEEDIKRAKIVCDLHKKVAKAELLSHTLLRKDGSMQCTTFAGGIEVIVDFEKQSYEIKEEK